MSELLSNILYFLTVVTFLISLPSNGFATPINSIHRLEILDSKIKMTGDSSSLSTEEEEEYISLLVLMSRCRDLIDISQKYKFKTKIFAEQKCICEGFQCPSEESWFGFASQIREMLGQGKDISSNEFRSGRLKLKLWNAGDAQATLGENPVLRRQIKIWLLEQKKRGENWSKNTERFFEANLK